MILNPSHDITLRGLPSEILDAYVRYKKGSRAIVAWLVQFGPENYKGVKKLPIKELAVLAQSVVANIKELPDVVHFHFKETITARKRLSQFFRKSIDLSENDADTVNHEHFTARFVISNRCRATINVESLNKIYLDLCEHCQAPCRPRSGSQASSSETKGLINNHFACLPVEGCPESHIFDATHAECEECQYEAAQYCSGSNTGFDIENDEMSVAIETATAIEVCLYTTDTYTWLTSLQHMHEVMNIAKSCWEKVGRGEVHFLAATGVTNLAWSALRALEDQLKDGEENISVGILHQRCCLFKKVTTDNSSSNQPPSSIHSLLESLEESDRAIAHYTNCHKLTVSARCTSCIQKPSDYVRDCSTLSTEHTSSFPIALFDNLLHHMCGTQIPTTILRSSPAFAEVGYLLSHRDDRSSVFRCVLGIQFLLTTYKAYLSALHQPVAISSCRITALQLSRQARTGVANLLNDKDAFPCRCPQTLAFHLSNLADDMETYFKHKCWDLYFQSPWVAGNHIIEMLDMLSYYGMYLLHYRHYVGAILHSYNALVQLAGLDTIPILEQICEMFGGVFFPSGRPTIHFKNSWARYIGARIKFKKGNKGHQNGKDGWCMAVPAHAARSSAGFGIDTDRTKSTIEAKFDYTKFDPVMKLKHMDWRIDSMTQMYSTVDPDIRKQKAWLTFPESWRPTSSSSSMSANSSNLSTYAERENSNPPPHPFLSYLTSFQPSLDPRPSSQSPALPTTGLNHFGILSTTLSLVRAITAETHAGLRDDECKLCICFASTLLAAADRIVEGRRAGRIECWRKEEREVVECVKTVLLRELRDKQERVRKEWVWEL